VIKCLPSVVVTGLSDTAFVPGWIYIREIHRTELRESHRTQLRETHRLRESHRIRESHRTEIRKMTYGIEWNNKPQRSEIEKKNLNTFCILDLPVEVLVIILSKMGYQELRNIELSSSFMR
jgi:hypothetical protein